MAKRTLGLAKTAKAKKQKREEQHTGKSASPEEAAASEEQQQQEQQLTVELPENIDANDEISQLKGLHQTYLTSERDNELLVNGIIHECDRLLRNSTDEKPLPPVFHTELAKFVEEESAETKIKEFFDAGLERIELGLEKHPNDVNLLIAKSKILIDQIVLQHIAPLNLESNKKDVEREINELLDTALEIYELAETKADELKDYSVFNDNETLDILEALDDLLDIVDNFGKNNLEEEEDDDDEEKDDEDDEDEDEDNEVELSEDHPLFVIKTSDKYNQWWRDHTHVYLDNLEKLQDKASSAIKREVNQRLGQSYLQEAEIPSNVFTTLKYDEDYQGLEELEGLSLEEAQKISQDLVSKALKYLKDAKDEEEPETWATVAEAMISLANLYEVDSKEQEDLYKEAEEILKKANNATNGKYKDVLENLLA
ncbi:ETT1 Enhancer of translation termination 1 [Candida maltosa Xu316]